MLEAFNQNLIIHLCRKWITLLVLQKKQKIMKSAIVKLLVLVAVLTSFSLQGFTPCLPNTTTVCISNLHWTDPYNVDHDYYSVQVVVGGPTVSDPTGWHTSNIVTSLPRTTEWFSTDYQHYWTVYSNHTNISVYAKKYSNSSYEWLGDTDTSDSRVTKTITYPDYMYYISFNASILGFPE